ncbi:MAG: hypothetical protein OEM25_08565 [Gammaproteobacteria bacterium]|nr:hypothetical protein [Gammaproteobacteria bacterium]
MFKTFIAGILLGIVAAAAAAYFIAPVDQYREQSLIVVHPNQGNTEVFHVNVPIDRILIGAPSQKNPVPPSLQWPADELLANTRAELFKIRNGKDAVVGVASRIAANNSDSDDIIEWVLHLPARGSAYAAMQLEPSEDGIRMGELLTGTREFASLRGPITERWIADTSGEEDAPAGRIEITTAFVSRGFAQ